MRIVTCQCLTLTTIGFCAVLTYLFCVIYIAQGSMNHQISRQHHQKRPELSKFER